MLRDEEIGGWLAYSEKGGSLHEGLSIPNSVWTDQKQERERERECIFGVFIIVNVLFFSRTRE